MIEENKRQFQNLEETNQQLLKDFDDHWEEIIGELNNYSEQII